jgi:hypothetical protein
MIFDVHECACEVLTLCCSNLMIQDRIELGGVHQSLVVSHLMRHSAETKTGLDRSTVSMTLMSPEKSMCAARRPRTSEHSDSAVEETFARLDNASISFLK